MKRIVFTICLTVIVQPYLFSQNIIAPAGGAAGVNWHLGGNNGAGSASSILGTVGGFNQPVFLYTNGIQRGIINSPTGAGGNGFWGFGDNFTTSYANPQALLHASSFVNLSGELFRTDCNTVYTAAWRLYTGVTPAAAFERFSLTVPAGSSNVFLQSSQGDMFFRTAGGAGPTVQERVHITSGVGNQIGIGQPNATRVNISYGGGYAPIANPVAMLNLGLDAPTLPTGGQRAWMDVGTFMCASSDNMYVGMKNEDPAGNFAPGSADRMDAVINWGDNLGTTPPFGPDNMRFIFTSVQNPATATGSASTNGLETMRITPMNGNIAYTGIGGDPQINLYSNGTNTPQNTLEINSPAPTNILALVANTSTGYLSAGLNGGTGRSGLRFTDLTSNSTVSAPAAANGKVLAVNSDGDVILVTGSSGTGVGTCAAPTTFAAAANGAINLTNNNNFYFEGNGAGNNVNNVVIGKACTAPVAKLDVLQASASAVGSTAVAITNTDAFGIGVNMNVTGGGGTSNNGMFSLVLGASTNNNGIVSTAFGGQNTLGGAFKGVAGTVQNIGVQGSASTTTPGTTNYGGYFDAQNAANIAGLTDYAVYGKATTASPSYWAGWFDGNVNINGTITANTYGPSDAALKTNISNITSASSLIEQLQPKTFFFDTLNPYGIHFNSSRQYGLVAQDVEQILPELISEVNKAASFDSLTQTQYQAISYKTLNYNAFIAILIKGMQEQNLVIDSLRAQMNSCCSMNARTSNPDVTQTDIHLSDAESVVLDQNVPNPFAEQTTITYNLPSTTKKAQMLFYDAQGKLINSVELKGTGKGQLNVFADDLSSGIYSYAMVVDGQVIDTKRMVKTN